ncbi:hypothetical protein ACFYWO_38105 [Streptomyces sp. NPDC002932]|uniref:hypothetical protein n=1 Tax=Streptomyces sp. NPDC002932 TaxID=3364672 RepID=UPI0036835041
MSQTMLATLLTTTIYAFVGMSFLAGVGLTPGAMMQGEESEEPLPSTPQAAVMVAFMFIAMLIAWPLLLFWLLVTGRSADAP